MTIRKNNKKTAKKSPTKKATAVKKKPARKTKAKQEMQYADGKFEKDELQKARDLEELMSVKKKSPFSTSDGSDFEENLASMSLTDMQELAVRAGIFPSGSKTTLKNKLLKEYKARAMGQYRKGQVTKPSLDPNSKRAKDLLKLINE